MVGLFCHYRGSLLTPVWSAQEKTIRRRRLASHSQPCRPRRQRLRWQVYSRAFIFTLPALCDCLATRTMYLGLTMTVLISKKISAARDGPVRYAHTYVCVCARMYVVLQAAILRPRKRRLVSPSASLNVVWIRHSLCVCACVRVCVCVCAYVGCTYVCTYVCI